MDENFHIKQLESILERLKRQIPTDLHKRLYEEWVYKGYIDDIDIESMWDPSQQGFIESSIEREALDFHWDDELIELAQSLNAIHYAISRIRYLEGERSILNDLRKALKAVLSD